MALSRGDDASRFTVDSPIGGLEAKTEFTIVQTGAGMEGTDRGSSSGVTLLKAFPVTGRTHQVWVSAAAVLCHACLSSATLSLRGNNCSQIRRHCAILGHPIVGDPRYGRPTPSSDDDDDDGGGDDDDATGTERLYLWASSLRLHHPISGQALFFEGCVPPSFFAWFRSEKPD